MSPRMVIAAAACVALMTLEGCGRGTPRSNRGRDATITEPGDGSSRPDGFIPDATFIPDGGTNFQWARLNFMTGPSVITDCSGDRYVRFADQYQKWVGLILCSPTRYKITMSATRRGIYLGVGDFAGHGQDHCELVNPAFRITNDDDIRSGGCSACGVGPIASPVGTEGWARSSFGSDFMMIQPWPSSANTVDWHECGISIP